MKAPIASIPLTPYQSVMIHGWMKPTGVLNWKHILSNSKLTWDFLRSQELEPESLKEIQPDPEEWIKHADVKIYMLPDMTCFPTHPIRHMNADIGEIWQMQWPSNTLQAMGVTFQELQDIGLTCEIMAKWCFSLNRWFMLGMRWRDVQGWSHADCAKIFKMSKQAVEMELLKLERIENTENTEKNDKKEKKR